MKITIGRKSVKTKVATMVINGMENEQMAAPGGPPLRLLSGPEVLRLEPFGEIIFTAAFRPRVGSAATWACSAGRSGSWIDTGRLLLPVRSKCDASW